MTSPSERRRILAVLVGGFCGTVTRYLLSIIVQGWLGKGWPYDIFLINITGAFVLAFVTTLADATFLVGPTRRLLINVGFLGAYTTFSSLTLGDVLLFRNGQWLLGVLYLLLSLLGGILAVLVGDATGRWFISKACRSNKPIKAWTTSPLKQIPQGGHVDVQDDVLLGDVRREK
jgi:fluoride exporter